MTSNVRNQGIAHLGFRAGGQPFCKSRRAHIVCAQADAATWGAICKRCQAKADKMKLKAATTTALAAATTCKIAEAADALASGDRAPAITGASRDLVQHAIFLADNARRDLGLKAGDGASARPPVASLNRTLDRLDSIIETLAKALN